MPFRHGAMERVMGIEPTSSAWKAEVINQYTTPAWCVERIRGIEPLSRPWQGRIIRPIYYIRMFNLDDRSRDPVLCYNLPTRPFLAWCLAITRWRLTASRLHQPVPIAGELPGTVWLAGLITVVSSLTRAFWAAPTRSPRQSRTSSKWIPSTLL